MINKEVATSAGKGNINDGVVLYFSYFQISADTCGIRNVRLAWDAEIWMKIYNVFKDSLLSRPERRAEEAEARRIKS